jgi:hypothetical protein
MEVRMSKFLKSGIRAVLAFARLSVSEHAFAATLVVQRNVNLRADPSTGMPPITLLMPPTILMLVTPQRQVATAVCVQTLDKWAGCGRRM